MGPRQADRFVSKLVAVTRSLALALATIALIAVACGRTDTGGSSQPTASSIIAPAAEPAARTPTTLATTTSSSIKARTVTLAFTGDLLLHNRVNELAAAHAANDPTRDYDYRPLLEPIVPFIENADWAICHLEVNLSADNTGLEPFPTFRSPGQIAADVSDIGYDSCSVASNHILDQGVEGVSETLEVLDAAGLGSSGAARNPSEAANQIWMEVGHVRIAHLAYSYGFNGFAVPNRAPWLANLIDESRIVADATRARAAGADIVILSLHWGEQYVTQANWQQRDIGPRLLASPDIDLIVGHHAHVVQPIERRDGEWLIYGLGNLLANATRQDRRDELLVQIEFTEQPDGTFSSTLRAIPLYVDYATLTVHPSNPQTRRPTTSPSLAAELDASWVRVQAVLRTGSGWDQFELG